MSKHLEQCGSHPVVKIMGVTFTDISHMTTITNVESAADELVAHLAAWRKEGHDEEPNLEE